jgi:blue copper oxidase
MTLSRRHFLAGSTAMLAAFGILSRKAYAFTTTLPLPPLVDLAETSGIAAFTAQRAKHAFVAGTDSDTYGYSGSYLGPIFRVRSGSTMQVKFKNELDVPTTVHWHGVFVPAVQDGGPHNLVEPSAVWEPKLTINQRASTAWYHPHPHGDTARQVHMGLAGLIYIEDETIAGLNLPSRYGVDDFPIVLQDRSFDAKGAMVYDASPMAVMHGSRGSNILVNGALAPWATVYKGLVRLRLLNGANARNFLLTFDDARSFHVIGNDNGFLPKPVEMSQLLIAPGERYEVLVDFGDGQGATLQTYPDHNSRFGNGFMQGLKARIASMTAETQPIMRFEADQSIAAVGTRLPVQLLELSPADETLGTKTRSFVLDSMMMANMPMMQEGGMMNMGGMDHSKMSSPDNMAGMDHSKMSGMGDMMSGQGMGMGMKMAINGKTFDMNRIDADPALGSAEIWDVTGTEMAHPFHVHGASFRILQLDGSAPPEHMAGWKDTVLVNESARLLVKFDQPATKGSPFMLHCHILEHEDAGMMAQFITV